MGLGLSYTFEKNADFRGFSNEIISDVAPDSQVIWLQGMNGSLAKARLNLAKAKSLPVVGAPVVGAHDIEFTSGASWFETDEIETPSFSAFFYGANDGAALGALLASFVGANDPGLFWYWSAATVMRVQVGQGVNVVRSATLTVTNPQFKKRYSLICDHLAATPALTLYNETDGTSAQALLTDVRDPGTLPMRVGSSRSISGSINGGKSRMFHGSLFRNIAFTPAQRLAHWAQVTRWSVADGVVENT